MKTPASFHRRSGSSAPREQDGAEPSDWSIVSARNPETGQAAVFRVRFSKPNRPDLASLVWAIVIQWPYENDQQIPPAEVNVAQESFEATLDPLAASSHSELVHVSTGMGLKEWIFYARSREEFMDELNELLSGHPRYPLDIEFVEDPGLGGVGLRGEGSAGTKRELKQRENQVPAES